MKHRSSLYRIEDIKDWSDRNELILNPAFQRRPVWKPKNKAYFLDTIINNLPTNKIFIHEYSENGKIKREVVDGQQRLRTILEFLENKIILPSFTLRVGNKRYNDLTLEEKRAFEKYELSIDVLHDATFDDVRDLFSRLNIYSVRLNPQELRNAEYHGDFKQFVYALSKEYTEYLSKYKIISEHSLSRMYEAELISEIIIGMLDGLQDKKKSINDFYSLYNDDFPLKIDIRTKFMNIMNIIEDLYGETIKNTSFKRRVLFYSLFLVIYDIYYGLKKQKGPYEISKNMNDSKHVLTLLSKKLKAKEIDPRYSLFIDSCRSQLDNIGPRIIRHNTILKEIFSS